MKQDGRDLLASSARSRPRAARSRCSGGAPAHRARSSLVLGRRLLGAAGRPWACSSPATTCEVERHADCGTSNVMILMAQVGAVRDVGAVHRVAARRLEARRRADPPRTRRGSGSTPTAAASHAVEATLAAARAVHGAAARPRCRATRSACAASSGPSSFPPHLRSTRYYRLRRRLRHLPVRVRTATRDRVADVRRRQRARVPAAPALVDEVARAAPACASAAPARRRARADRDDRARGARWPSVRAPRRSSSVAVAVVTTAIVAAPARHPARAGARRCSPASSAGASRVLLALGLADWDWGADGLAPPHARDRHPGHDGGAVALDLLAAPGLAGDRRARRSRRRAAAAAGRSGTGIAVLAPLPRAVRARPARRASARSSSAGGPSGALGRRGRRAAPPRARGGRRRLHQARPDRRDPRRPRAAARSAPSSPRCRTGSRPSRSRRSGPCSRPSSVADVDERVRRVRLGAARRGIDRPDLPRPAAHRRGRRREGAATGHRAT